jgi:hypothetical protein
MDYSYGAANALNTYPLSVFAPSTWNPCAPRDVAAVENAPQVRDQSSFPVCSAVVALSMYEALLLREKLDDSMHAELNWAWLYLWGRRFAHRDLTIADEQLLTGIPLLAALKALVERGVLAYGDLQLEGPDELEEQLRHLDYTPWGALAAPLRVLALLPTATSIYDALAAQHVVGFAFAIDSETDRWLNSELEQARTGYELPSPIPGRVRLATHAALIIALDMTSARVTVQNSFGARFGANGLFFIPVSLLLRQEFASLEFYILARAG